MTRAIRNLVGVCGKSFAAKAILSAAILGAAPMTALAGHHDDFDRRDYDHHSSGRVDIDVRSGPEVVVPQDRVWVPPVYRTVTVREWAPAQYRTVTERVWREGGTQCVTERVWVPDRYEWRDRMSSDRGYWHPIRESVLVERGHWIEQKRDVPVAGHYEDVSRQELVCDGRWQDVQKQELVSAGHWEACASPVVVKPEPRFRLDLHLPIRW